MKIKTSELIGHALDYAVCIAIANPYLHWEEFSPSINWSQGGPIIERELICYNKSMGTYWTWLNSDAEGDRNPKASGPTLLIASMRCYVTSKLGNEVEIPEELI